MNALSSTATVQASAPNESTSYKGRMLPLLQIKLENSRLYSWPSTTPISAPYSIDWQVAQSIRRAIHNSLLFNVKGLRSWVDPVGREHICVDAIKIGSECYIYTLVNDPEPIPGSLAWPDMRTGCFKINEHARDSRELQEISSDVFYNLARTHHRTFMS
ncbi:hypothetical protein BC835DRAFT_512712 [Cytidiella melzeri]|nr:hypothetical protein BC835DRAFT_512712 [Cytidiella melzeri]